MESCPQAYRARRPEATALYEVVRDSLETLYGAIDDGALDVRIPKHARKELEAYLDCGILGRGFRAPADSLVNRNRREGAERRMGEANGRPNGASLPGPAVSISGLGRPRRRCGDHP